jgi:hypothetical protein
MLIQLLHPLPRKSPDHALEKPAQKTTDDDPPSETQGRGEKESQGILAGGLEGGKGWLEPWIMLRRYWRAFSGMPPPRELRTLLERVFCGEGLYLYAH